MPPLTGWATVNEANYKEIAPKIPKVLPGVVYAYLAEGVGRSIAADGAFRALSRGYTHWASGRLDKLKVNTNHRKYCHVRSVMKPSMKQGVYHVYLLLEKTEGNIASICVATCECAAG